MHPDWVEQHKDRLIHRGEYFFRSNLPDIKAEREEKKGRSNEGGRMDGMDGTNSSVEWAIG